jgi:hypothetical protein
MKEKCIVTVASKSVKEEARDRVRPAQESSWPCNSQKSPKVAASKKRREMGRTLLMCLSLGRANGGGGGRGGRKEWTQGGGGRIVASHAASSFRRPKQGAHWHQQTWSRWWWRATSGGAWQVLDLLATGLVVPYPAQADGR